MGSQRALELPVLHPTPPLPLLTCVCTSLVEIEQVTDCGNVAQQTYWDMGMLHHMVFVALVVFGH